MMRPSLKELQEAFLQSTEPEIPNRDNEIDLHLSKNDFMTKMGKEDRGWTMLDLLSNGEWSTCERLGLIVGYNDEQDQIWFDIPDWNKLVAHLTAVVNS